MNPPRSVLRAIVCLALLVTIASGTAAPARQTPTSIKSAQSTAASRESGQILTQPVLVKGSPTNYGTNGFDISWVDNST